MNGKEEKAGYTRLGGEDSSRSYGSFLDSHEEGRKGSEKVNDKSPTVIVVSIISLVVICIIVGVAIWASGGGTEDAVDQPVKLFGVYENAAVAVDGEPCAAIGADILKDGGTAVDAAIGALFCNGVYNSHSMGIGGGFLMTIYSRAEGTVKCLNARETAPGLATTDMFHGNGSLSSKGPLSVAVPGEIAGYWEARRQYGNLSLSWRRIMQPTIDMCREGIPVSATMEDQIAGRKFTDPNIKSVLIDPATWEGWKEGQTYTRTALADTLEALADAGDNGDELFYNGSIAVELVNDLSKLGGILSLSDLATYKPEWVDPITVHMPSTNLTLYSMPPPGSGAVLAAILNIMENFPVEKDDPLFYHRVVESFKWAYGARSNLGDPNDKDITEFVENLVAEMTSSEWAFEKHLLINDSSTVNAPRYYGSDVLNPRDGGTAHLSIVAPNGDAVAVTSTVNLVFGSEIMSPGTGIIYNDQMDDFSFPGIVNDFDLPPSPNNFPKPGKRPLSSMSPSIFVDQSGDVRLVVGASGGTKITTATALTSLLNLRLGWDIEKSVEASRIHHQLNPMTVEYQSTLQTEVVQGLIDRGHVVEDIGGAGSVVGAIDRKENGNLWAKADSRKSGGVGGF